MTQEYSSQRQNPVVWMRRQWNLERNPFPQGAIASQAREDNRENGRLFRPEVRPDKIQEAIDKFVVGAVFSGLKFGYLWSISGPANNEYRGYGKSSMLQYLVEETNKDFGAGLLAQAGFTYAEAGTEPVCGILASFDKGVNTSLAAVFLQATEYACRYRNPKTKYEPEGKTLAERLHGRLVDRLGTDDPTVLADAVQRASDELRGRTLGPPLDDFIQLLCAGDSVALGRYVGQVKAGARTRVGAANFLATFLLFAKAAGVSHVLLGCDQLEDFAATTTSKQKRVLETERFRDFVLELMPMADMLTILVTMHPEAERAIIEMWRLADLPSMAWNLQENEGHVVILREIETVDQTKALLQPYLDEARTSKVPTSDLSPFTDGACEALLGRSDGKPRDILRKAHALIQRAARENWPSIDGEQTRTVLDSLALPEDVAEGGWGAATSGTSLEEKMVIPYSGPRFESLCATIHRLAQEPDTTRGPERGPRWERRVANALRLLGFAIQSVPARTGVHRVRCASGFSHQIDAETRCDRALVVAEWKAFSGLVRKNEIPQFKAVTDDIYETLSQRPHQAGVLRVFGIAGDGGLELRRYAACHGMALVEKSRWPAPVLTDPRLRWADGERLGAGDRWLAWLWRPIQEVIQPMPDGPFLIPRPPSAAAVDALLLLHERWSDRLTRLVEGGFVAYGDVMAAIS